MIKTFFSRLFGKPRPFSEPPSNEARSATVEAPAGREPRHARRDDRPRAVAPAEQRASAPPPVDADAAPAKRRRRRRKPGGAGQQQAPSEAAPQARRPGVSVGPQPRTERFGDVAVSEPVARALAEMRYTQPTPVQSLVIAPMLEGKDLVGQAQTGTGKTAAFGIPIAENVDGSEGFVQALVLVPTRELARQVSDELSEIVRYRGAYVAAVYGGAPIAGQIKALAAGAQIVVGTPGRIIDLLDRGNLVVDRARTVVLDEADQMLDIGFLPDIRRILRSTPRSRQTALFTATVPTAIRRLIYSYLREPQWFRVGEESEPVESVRQVYCEVANRDKLAALIEVLKSQEPGEQTLAFRRTQEDVEWLARALSRKGIDCGAIHGGLRQTERNAVMGAFRQGKLKLLVSTNLTSRGIDVPTVGCVINYDIPEQVEEYVHRIGRTARMGRPGIAITFVGEWDVEFFDAIRNHVGADKLEPFELSLYKPKDAQVGVA